MATIRDTRERLGHHLSESAATAAMMRKAVHPPADKTRRISGGLASWQIRVSLETIEATLDQPISLRMLASKVGLSVKHFGHSFRRSLGTTPHRWILRRRVARVCELLTATDEPLAAIACLSGFADQSHMTCAFRRHMSITPRRYRFAARREQADPPGPGGGEHLRRSAQHFGPPDNGVGRVQAAYAS